MSESLFKFFPYSVHDLDAIANNYLWFSHYSKFNDPFEDVFINNAIDNKQDEFDEIKAIEFYMDLHRGQILPTVVKQQINEMKLKGTFEHEYHRLIKNTFLKAKHNFEHFLAKSKACCFARNSDYGDALKSRLMWSHYADGLRGFCIEFDQELLLKGISQNIGKNIGTTTMQYGKLKKFPFEELATNTAKNSNSDTSSFGIGSILSYKSKEWEYESEYRLVTDIGNEIEIPIESITSITVGSKMSKKKLITLKSILKGNPRVKCSLFEAYIDVNTFELEKRKLLEIE